MLTSLDTGDSIVVAKSFSHMLNLAEVQIAYRRRIKLKKGVFTEESSATTESDSEETIKRLGKGRFRGLMPMVNINQSISAVMLLYRL